MKKQEAYHLVLYRGKPHGFKGHIKFQFESEVTENFIDIEHLYAKKDGNYIPYFVEEISIPNNKYCIIKLEEVHDDSSNIQELYILEDDITEYLLEDDLDDDLVGYECIDTTYGILGKLIRIDQLPGQELAVIQFKEKELLIPLVADFIHEIDDNKQQVIFNLPEGFLEIFE